MKTIVIDEQQHATIIAALRYYQQQGMGDPTHRSDEIHDIATNMDEVISLDSDGIDELVVQLQDVSAEQSILSIASILETVNDAINSYEDAGCEECGTISSVSYDKLVQLRDSMAKAGGWDTPRVLVIVSGGIADCVHDEGVRVEIFDWDNFNDEEDVNKAEMAVLASFRDLAEPLSIPVKGDVYPAKDDDSSPKDNYTDILQHRIKWWLREENAPSDLDECSIEHIEKCIREGYREGELCVLSNDGDTEYRGWWSIKFCS